MIYVSRYVEKEEVVTGSGRKVLPCRGADPKHLPLTRGRVNPYKFQFCHLEGGSQLGGVPCHLAFASLNPLGA